MSSGDVSTFKLTGPGTLLELAFGNAVIGDAGIGAMTISSGAELKTDDVGDPYSLGGRVILGGTAGGRGTLTVTGDASTLQAAGQIQLNQGKLSILAGAEASSLGLAIGSATGGNASARVIGAGSRLNTGDVTLGGGSGVSSLTIANAGFAELGSLNIGLAGFSTNSLLGTNTVLVEGAGSTLELHGELDLGEYAVGPGGHFANASGSLEVTSGAEVLQDSDSMDVVGQEGHSTAPFWCRVLVRHSIPGLHLSL